MKVYLATAGEYSDYRVVHVFAREEDARAYSLADDVDEREVIDGPLTTRPWYRLLWNSGLPDREAVTGRYMSNPWESDEERDYIPGEFPRASHRWDPGVQGPVLWVEGWDLRAVRKVYSEQRAQHLARRG